MMEFIIGAVCGIVGFMFLMDWMSLKHDKIQNSSPRELEDIVGNVLRENTIMMHVEFDKVTQLYFCYDSITNYYVCQGHNLKEIQKAFKLRYPSKLGHILSRYDNLFPKKEWADQKEWHGPEEMDNHLEDFKGSKYVDVLEKMIKDIPKTRAKKKKKNDK